MKKISKNLITGLIGLGLVSSFSGCGSKTVNVGKVNTVKSNKVLNFSSDELGGKRNINNMDFSSQIQALSKYKYSETRLTGAINGLKGVKVKKENAVYQIEYINGERYNTNDIFATKTSYPLKVRFEGQKVIFAYPHTYQSIDSRDGIGVKISPLDNQANISKDMKNIYANLDKLKLNKHYDFKGEINTKYPDKSVYANFKRLLGSYYNREQISNIKKRNTFSLNVNGKKYPLYVEVVPYRDGSKVLYSTTLNYWLDTNGKSSLSKNDIQSLHSKIKNIANN